MKEEETTVRSSLLNGEEEHDRGTGLQSRAFSHSKRIYREQALRRAQALGYLGDLPPSGI